MTVIFNQSVTLLKPRRVDSLYSSETVESWDDPVPVGVPFRVSVQPVATSEGPVERPQVTTRYRLYTPENTDIPQLAAGDRIDMGGWQLSVMGDPQRWPHPLVAGRVHHLECALEVISG